MSQYVPLNITAHLECGAVCDTFLPIDGILKYQILRERHGAQDVTVPGVELHSTDESSKWEQQGMPLLKVGKHVSRWWYYAASFAVWPDHVADGTDHWVKKFDSRLIDLLESKTPKRLDVGRGRYRAYHMPVFYRATSHVDWYVVGDRVRIESLLSTVTHIGKKTAQGWGAVSRWTVEPHAEDWSCWRDGKPMRAIPASEGVLYGVRPSYWSPANQTACILPART